MLVILTLSYLLVFAGLPLIYNVVISFQTVDVFSLGTLMHPSAGVENYVDIFEDRQAETVLRNTIIFTLGSVALQFTLGFALALFFHQNFTGATWIRGLFLCRLGDAGSRGGGVVELASVGRFRRRELRPGRAWP